MKKPNYYSYEDLLACGHGNLFGPGNAQLPLPPMLMFDRITHISEDGGAFDKGEIIAELDINPELWFFECHFENDSVMPGCLGLDALWQLVGFFLDGRVAQDKVEHWGLGKLNLPDKLHQNALKLGIMCL